MFIKISGYVFMYVCMYVCMYACVYVYMNNMMYVFNKMMLDLVS